MHILPFKTEFTSEISDKIGSGAVRLIGKLSQKAVPDAQNFIGHTP